MTLGEALKRYKADVASKKRQPLQEYGRIDRCLRNDLSFRMLANLTGADFAKYRDQRRADGRAENTIRLELQLVSHLYEIARKKWGMEGLLNRSTISESLQAAALVLVDWRPANTSCLNCQHERDSHVAVGTST